MIPHFELAQAASRVYQAPWSATVAGDVHYALLPRASEIVVALPGTHPQEARDWLRDADFWPANVHGLWLVHGGFGRGAAAAWAKAAPSLGADKLVTFTGHSLGGALALCLAAIHAVERPHVPFRVVTFAAPRVAFLNPIFRCRLAAARERVVYARRGDLVPDLPDRWLWSHGAKATRIGESCGDWIADHDVTRYAADLAALKL